MLSHIPSLIIAKHNPIVWFDLVITIYGIGDMWIMQSLPYYECLTLHGHKR